MRLLSLGFARASFHGRALGAQLFCEGDEFGGTRQVLSQGLGNIESLFSLVVLHNTAQRTLGGTQRRIKAVHILLDAISLADGTISNIQIPALVVGTV